MKTKTLKAGTAINHLKCWANDQALLQAIRAAGEGALDASGWTTTLDEAETFQLVGRVTIAGRRYEVLTLLNAPGVPSSKHHYLRAV